MSLRFLRSLIGTLLRYRHLILYLVGIATGISLLIGAVLWIIEAEDRRKLARYQAWSILIDGVGHVAEAGRRDAILDLLSNEAPLSGLDLRNAIIPALSFSNSEITLADFTNSISQRFEVRNVSFFDSTMKGGQFTESKFLNSRFVKTTISESTFDVCSIKKVRFDNIDARKASFFGCTMNDVDFRNAVLSGSYFGSADLSNITFAHGQAEDADFQRASLENVSLIAMDLTSAIFLQSYGNVLISDSNFSRATFQTAKLVNCTFRNTNLFKTNFRDATISDCRLIRTEIEQADFSRVNFMTANDKHNCADWTQLCELEVGVLLSDVFGANVKLDFAEGRVQIENSELRNASFRSANLDGSRILNSNLESSIFQKASLRGVRFSGGSLAHVDFTDADLTNATIENVAGLESANFSSAITTNLECAKCESAVDMRFRSPSR